jgi:phosphoribosyl 1,2-cyclic phosphodiesterase
MRFCVLASGSSGNASLLIEGCYGILVDLGLGPRVLAGRLAEVGMSWEQIHAAFLTHVHGDHWNENTLGHLWRRGIPLYCHPSHATALKDESSAFTELLENDRLRFYDVGRDLTLPACVRCRPLALSHDGGVTCGFRFEGGPDVLGQTWALAYAADLGSWDGTLADALADVDILALEFNHDETMERQSRRSPSLIERVLGDEGHLSNDQAAELLTEVLHRSANRGLQHLVQLHLSRQCNRPGLARAAARRVLRERHMGIPVHTAQQHCSVAWLSARAARSPDHRRKRTARAAVAVRQPLLPGWEA